MLHSSSSKDELQAASRFGKQHWLHFCFVLLSCGVTEVFSSSPPKTLASNIVEHLLYTLAMYFPTFLVLCVTF